MIVAMRVMLMVVVTPQDVENFGKEILSRLYVETLIHGNTSPAGAKEIQDMVEKVLKARALAEGEKVNPRALVLPPGQLLAFSRIRQLTYSISIRLVQGSP